MDFKKAEEKYEESRRIKADYYDAYVSLGNLDFERGKLALGLAIPPPTCAHPVSFFLSIPLGYIGGQCKDAMELGRGRLPWAARFFHPVSQDSWTAVRVCLRFHSWVCLCGLSGRLARMSDNIRRSHVAMANLLVPV